jgi:hypothetical protein
LYRARVEAGAAAVELRPLSIGEILDVGIKIYWRNALALFGLVIAVVFPVQILSGLVESSATPTGFSNDPFNPTIDPSTTISGQDAAVYGVGVLVVSILGFVAAQLATGACFKAVVDAYLEETVQWKTSMLFAAKRVHSIIWVSLISTIVAGIGLIFCIVPGVWLWVSWVVAIPVLLTEGLKGTRALGRSRELVSGRWWPTFAVAALAALLAGIVTGVLAGILAGFSVADPATTTGTVLSVLTGTVSAMVTTPFTAAVITVLYIDLRVRKEGFDVQLLAERLGLAPKPGGYRPAPAYTGRPALQSGEAPPFWPPPPGWQPRPAPEGTLAPTSAQPPAPAHASETPPFWPPPASWQPAAQGAPTAGADDWADAPGGVVPPPEAPASDEEEQPPFWPPPPGWRPGGPAE